MGLSASMWTGVSGLLAHGEKMNVLGNNIANVNTVGFKASTMHFEDFFYQTVSTTAQDRGQIGRGVSVAAIFGDFSQGSFETTNEATDLAIGGNGFFGVSPLGSEDMYYTRAGNFRFDKDGYLMDPHGYCLQGWEIVEQPTQASTTTTQVDDPENQSAIRGVGTPDNIQLEGFTAEPKHTSRVTIINNLDAAEGLDNTRSSNGNPFFAMAQNWDGREDPPIGNTSYAYSSTIKVYDEAGTSHNLTVYYDQVDPDTLSNAEGQTHWEYIVTMDPEEDKRVLGSALENTSGAGLLMVGTLSFNSGGQLEDMSAFTLVSNATSTNIGSGNWRPTANSENGYPLMATNFTGLDNASAVIDSAGDPIIPTPSNASGKLIEMNFGLSTTPNAEWTENANTTAGAVGSGAGSLPGYGSDASRASKATTNYDGSSSTLFMSQDGYTFGFLQNVAIDQDGILTGRYSNGVTLELYQITLYDFLSETNLNRAGGNLFTQTLESGEASPGPANNNGLGSIISNSLEQSNVDLAREFVQMITTQRGFSANGKVITTTDQMLSEIIMLKR